MEARAPHWRAAVLPVGFAIVCVSLMIATWVSFGGPLPFEAQGYRFYLPLPAATSIYPDTSVRISGITVGKVISVDRAGAHARVLVQLQSQYAPLRSGAKAIVRSKTLLGEGYIAIVPGAPGAAPVPDGGSLPSSAAVPTQRLSDVLRLFTPTSRLHLREMFTGLAAAVRERGGSLNGAVAASGPAVTSFAAVSRALEAQSGSLSSLIADGGRVLHTLGQRVGLIQSLVRHGDSALSVVAASDRGLEATITALPNFLSRLRETSGLLTATGPEISAAVGSLNAATVQLPEALRAINADAPVFGSLFRRLPAVLSTARVELPQLDRVLYRAGADFPAVETATRQLIPILQLISADRTSVVGSLANAAQIQNGVMQAPGLGLVHYAAGAVTVWNETVGGWVHKLPSNRSNPYPKPGSENDIATGGLHAFDCRNTGNHQYLPPTGTGAPTCSVQGPWKFDGRSSYYPRLQPAPP